MAKATSKMRRRAAVGKSPENQPIEDPAVTLWRRWMRDRRDFELLEDYLQCPPVFDLPETRQEWEDRDLRALNALADHKSDTMPSILCRLHAMIMTANPGAFPMVDVSIALGIAETMDANLFPDDVYNTISFDLLAVAKLGNHR